MVFKINCVLTMIESVLSSSLFF